MLICSRTLYKETNEGDPSHSLFIQLCSIIDVILVFNLERVDFSVVIPVYKGTIAAGNSD